MTMSGLAVADSTVGASAEEEAVGLHYYSVDSAEKVGQAGRLRFEVPFSSTQVRIVFNPSSIEKARRLELLNQSMRLGYKLPKASTR